MKECPSCRKVYSDDLFFCLDDGSPLLVVEGSIDSLAPTEVAVDIGQSARTEFLPHVSGSVDTDPPPPQFTAQEIPTQVVSRPFGVNTVAPTGTSPWLYLVIGVLATALAATGLFIFMSRDKDNKTLAENKNPDQTNLASSNTKTPEKAQTAANVSAPPRSTPGLSSGSSGILPQLTEESVRSVLNAWVQAQNSKSFSTYQACYDASFVGVKTVKNGHSRTYTYASWMRSHGLCTIR